MMSQFSRYCENFSRFAALVFPFAALRVAGIRR
jgi:hypothetical protein